MRARAQAFDKYDSDKDGKLSRQELRAALTSLHLGFSSGDLAAIIEKADSSGDQMVDYREFCATFRIPERYAVRPFPGIHHSTAALPPLSPP